jgi:hypothetical protein
VVKIIEVKDGHPRDEQGREGPKREGGFQRPRSARGLRRGRIPSVRLRLARDARVRVSEPGAAMEAGAPRRRRRLGVGAVARGRRLAAAAGSASAVRTAGNGGVRVTAPVISAAVAVAVSAVFREGGAPVMAMAGKLQLWDGARDRDRDRGREKLPVAPDLVRVRRGGVVAVLQVAEGGACVREERDHALVARAARGRPHPLPEEL